MWLKNMPYYVYKFSYVNAFETKLRPLLAWKICFRILHLTGWSADAERRFRWRQWNAPQRIIFKVRTNNIGRNVKKHRLATGVDKVPEKMLEEVWITKWWQAKRSFHRGKCTAVLLMPQKHRRKRSPSNKRLWSQTFVNVEYVRGLLTNICVLRWLKVSKQTFTVRARVVQSNTSFYYC
jgi:hypothetical protein